MASRCRRYRVGRTRRATGKFSAFSERRSRSGRPSGREGAVVVGAAIPNIVTLRQHACPRRETTSRASVLSRRYKQRDRGSGGRMANVDNRDVGAALQAVLPALVEGLPAVLDRVGRVLEDSWPEYAAFLTTQRIEVVRTGRLAVSQIVATAQRSLVDEGFASPGDADSGLLLFEEIGRVQWRSGNSLETLMSAYQTGARIAWREMALISVRNQVPASAVALLADALFAFVDHLSAASARGYVEEQSASVSERERARTDLVELLLSDRSDHRLIEATAQRARWPLPTTVAIVLIPDEPVALDLLSLLGP